MHKFSIAECDLTQDLETFKYKNTSAGRIIFEKYGAKSNNLVNGLNRVPYILQDGVIKWSVPLKQVTLGNYFDTFFPDVSEKSEIAFYESDQGFQIPDIKMANKVFFKYLKNACKTWRPLKKSIKLKTFKQYVDNTEVPVRFVFSAIWLRKSYTKGEFAALFQVSEENVDFLLSVAGYLKKDTDVDYLITPQFVESVKDCLDKSDLANAELDKSILIKNQILRGIYRKLNDFGESISAFAMGKEYFVHPQSSWDEPAYSKRNNWQEKIPSAIFVLGMLAVIILSIIIFAYQLKTTTSEHTDTLYSFWGAIVGSFVAGLVTIFTTYLIIHRSDKLDYHQERLAVMPIFEVAKIKGGLFLEASDSYTLPEDITDIVGNSQYFNLGYEIDDAMLLEITNIGKHIAFSVTIDGLSPYYEEPEFQSIASERKIYFTVYNKQDFEFKVKYYDIYGNYYYQLFRTNRNQSTSNYTVIESFPPELVLRTKRTRYIQ